MKNDTDADEPVPPLLLDLFQAYYDARRNKRGTINALRFELDFESRIFELYEDIVSRRYEISRSTCFIVKKPVQREIFAGDFRDRIVHHLLYNYLNPLCERLFIFDTYGCRMGKGTSCGIRRADHFIRSCSRNYTKDCHILKLDIRGYFMSIHRDILYGKVAAIVERFRGKAPFDADITLWLLRKIIFHDHTKHCHIKGNRSDWIGLPFSKSLFHAAPGCGLPIGNLTSQLFGNIYLNDFDHFATRLIPDVRYGRYVDDMLFAHRDKEALKSFLPKIRSYLRQKLSLELHPKKIYLQYYSKGVDFLGVSIRPYRIYPRHRLKGNMWKAIMKWNGIIEHQGGRLSDWQIREFLSSINSYLGNLSAYRTRTLRRTILRRLSPGFWRYATYGSPYRKLSRRLPGGCRVNLGFDGKGSWRYTGDIVLRKSMKHEETTNEELAIMINNGFQSVTDSINALTERVGGVETRLDGVETRLDGVETRLDGVETRLDGVETRLDGVETRLDRVEMRIGSLEEKTEYIDQKLSRIDRRQEQQMDEQYGRMSAAENDIKEIRKHVGLKPAKIPA